MPSFEIPIFNAILLSHTLIIDPFRNSVAKNLICFVVHNVCFIEISSKYISNTLQTTVTTNFYETDVINKISYRCGIFDFVSSRSFKTLIRKPQKKKILSFIPLASKNWPNKKKIKHLLCLKFF